MTPHGELQKAALLNVCRTSCPCTYARLDRGSTRRRRGCTRGTDIDGDARIGSTDVGRWQGVATFRARGVEERTCQTFERRLVELNHELVLLSTDIADVGRSKKRHRNKRQGYIRNRVRAVPKRSAGAPFTFPLFSAYRLKARRLQIVLPVRHIYLELETTNSFLPIPTLTQRSCSGGIDVCTMLT